MRKEGIGYLPELDNLEDTVYSALEFFKQERSRVRFFDYIRKRYGNKSDSTIRLILNTLTNYGLIREMQDYVYVISERGRLWLEQGSDEDLIKIIHEHVEYVGELLKQLETQKQTREALQDRALKYYGFEFNNTELTRRLQMLKSVGMVSVNRHKEYNITEKGRNFISKVDLRESVTDEIAKKSQDDKKYYSQEKNDLKVKPSRDSEEQERSVPVYAITLMDEKAVVGTFYEMLKDFMYEHNYPYKVTRNARIRCADCEGQGEVIPDILVYQDKDGNKLLRWVIEIVSANSRDEDFLNKLFYYRQIGVSECWMVDDISQNIYIYNWKEGIFDQKEFTNTVENKEFPGLGINLRKIILNHEEIVVIDI